MPPVMSDPLAWIEAIGSVAATIGTRPGPVNHTSRPSSSSQRGVRLPEPTGAFRGAVTQTAPIYAMAWEKTGRLPDLCHVFASSEPVDLHADDRTIFAAAADKYSAIAAVLAAGRPATIRRPAGQRPRGRPRSPLMPIW